jgi:hypothetical protein
MYERRGTLNKHNEMPMVVTDAFLKIEKRDGWTGLDRDKIQNERYMKKNIGALRAQKVMIELKGLSRV